MLLRGATVPLLLAASILPESSVLASEARLCSDKSEFVEAEIVLTDAPFCGFFVVLTEGGFALLNSHAGYETIAEGDRVSGFRDMLGRQQIEVLLEPRLRTKIGPRIVDVTVEQTGVGLDAAKASYYRRCNLDGASAEFVVQ